MFKNIKEKVNIKLVFLIIIAFFVVAVISLVETNKEYVNQRKDKQENILCPYI